MNPKNFNNIIDSVLNEDRLPSGGKSKKERYKDPKTRAMLKRSVKKHDAKTDANGDTQVQKRDRARQARDRPAGKWGKKMGKVSKPGSTTCSRPTCSNKAVEADHTSRSGNNTQDLCKSCHQKVTDSRREQKGLDLNYINRAVTQILTEAEPGGGWNPNDFSSAMPYKGERKLGGYKGKAKNRRIQVPKYSKKQDDRAYNFTVYHHPNYPADQTLIIPGRANDNDLKNDFDVIGQAIRPETYHSITTKKGETYVGRIESGHLESLSQGSGWVTGAEGLISIYDVRLGKTVTIPKFTGAKEYRQGEEEWPPTPGGRHPGGEKSGEKVKRHGNLLQPDDIIPGILAFQAKIINYQQLHASLLSAIKNQVSVIDALMLGDQDLGLQAIDDNSYESIASMTKKQLATVKGDANQLYQFILKKLPVDVSKLTQEFVSVRGEDNINLANTHVIGEEDDQYWSVHSQFIRKELNEKGKSKFKEILSPRKDESLQDYESRVKPIPTRKDLFSRFHALEFNKESDKYRWLRDAGSEENLPKIAAFVPTNMGGSSVDLLSNISDVNTPDWLMDPNGGTAIEKAIGVGPDGELLPTSKRSERKQSNKKARKEISWLKKEDLKVMKDRVSNPFSKASLAHIYDNLSKNRRAELNAKAQNDVIYNMAVNLAGDSLKWEKLSQEENTEYLTQAAKAIKNIKNIDPIEYEEKLKNAAINRLWADKVRQLGLEKIAEFKKCSRCKGSGKIETDLPSREEPISTPLPPADIKRARKKAAGKSMVQKCPSCYGTGLAPIDSAKGYQPKRNDKEIENFAKATQGMMTQLFRAECSECAEVPEGVPCPSCNGAGFNDTKLQSIRKEWGQLLKGFFGEDYFGEEDSIKFVEKLYKSIANYDRSAGRIEGPSGKDYSIVYEQENQIAPALQSHPAIKRVRPLDQGEPVRWGFMAGSEAGKSESELGELLRKRGVPVPYESKSRSGPRRTVQVSKLYDETLERQELRGLIKKARNNDEMAIKVLKGKKMTNLIRGHKGKGGLPNLLHNFIEIRKFPTAQKHFENELRGLAVSDPRLRLKFKELMKGAGGAIAMKEIFRNNKQLAQQAIESYEPKPNEVKGVGLITNIETGTLGTYEHPGEQAAIDLASLRGEDYESFDRTKQQEYQKYAYAMRLLAQFRDVDINDIEKVNQLWNDTDMAERSSFMFKAHTGGSELTTKKHKDYLAHRHFKVHYVDIETGEEGRITLGPTGSVNIVEPLVNLFSKGKKLAQREAKKQAKQRGEPEDIIKQQAEKPMENLIRTSLPVRLERKSYTPDDIARFIN